MRERFESDEFKTYMEAYRAAEQARVEELSRNEEFVRVPEFPPESSLSARNALRRRNRRKQRSILAGLLSAIGTAAGAVLIVAAVVLTFTQVSLTSFSAATHSLEFELAIEWAENSELTARLTSESEQHEQSLSDGDNNYTLRFDELTPDTEYHLEITDGSTVCFSGDYRTEAIEPLTPVGETLLPDGISLTFDGTALTGEYTVYLDGAAAGTIRAEQAEIAWTGLNAKTSYRVTVEDEHGDTVFDKTYHTPAYEISVTETAAELYMTSIRVELNVEHADAPLTATLGGNTQTLQNGANVLLATDLTPGTEYTLEVRDGEGNICFTKTYVTNRYEQKLFPAETVLQESITLQFNAAELTSDSYTVRLDGAEAESLSAAHTTLVFANLTPETSYRVTIEDEHGDTVFDKTYHTPAYEISVTETAAELYMTRIRVELTVEHADTPLTATLGGLSQALQNGANVLLATDLTPGTAYTLEVKDGEGNVCFTKTYVTNTYEQKLFPDETVLQESITLQFDAAELTSDSYTIRLDGAEAESLSAAHATVTFANLTPETSYRVTVEDEHGDTVFDKTYTTPAYEISVTETAAELYMTRIRVELTVEHADTPLTAQFGGNTQTLQNGANMLEMTGLNPGSTYAISVYNGEEQVFFQTYRTQNYVQTLFTVEEYIGTDMIFLQFDEAALPEEGYTVYVAGALSGSLNKNNSFIQLNDLTPNTRYHIEILDSNGDLMLDAYYLTPYAVVNMGEVSCTPVSIRFTAFVESETGLADVVLRSASGEVYSSVISPETGGDISFTGLTPMTEYTLTITDDRGNVCYENVFRTELSYTLLSISGNQITLEFPAWQFDGAEGIELSLNGTPTDIVFAGGEVTLSDLTPQTEYSVSVRVNGVLWWQNSFTTPDIILDSAEPTVGSTDLSVTFRVQNPQSEPLRVVLLMGDIEQDAETFTEAEFTASFTTIPNGRYVVRLVRESDGLTLWQAVLVTNY